MMQKISDFANKSKKTQIPKLPVEPTTNLNAVRRWVIGEILEEERQRLTTRVNSEKNTSEQRLNHLHKIKAHVDDALDILDALVQVKKP